MLKIKEIANIQIYNRKLGAGEVAQFLSKLAFALGSGLNLSYALKTIRGQNKNNNFRNALQKSKMGLHRAGVYRRS